MNPSINVHNTPITDIHSTTEHEYMSYDSLKHLDAHLFRYDVLEGITISAARASKILRVLHAELKTNELFSCVTPALGMSQTLRQS